MFDLQSQIQAAWQRIHPILQSNPTDLNRRLARRNTPTLRRPPRTWCLAIRASDILARELESWRRRPYAELLEAVGRDRVQSTVWVGQAYTTFERTCYDE